MYRHQVVEALTRDEFVHILDAMTAEGWEIVGFGSQYSTFNALLRRKVAE